LLWCRPVFSEACVFCGLCVKTCPAQALAQARGQKPILNPRLCIECCCCHEVCPANAIDMRLSPLFQRLKARDKCLR
jgi:MinD superfamily P-loop ATPase